MSSKVVASPGEFKELFPDFETKDIEVFTQQSWLSLFRKAARAKVPSFIIGVTFSGKVAKAYDGQYLVSYLLNEGEKRKKTLDPYTRKTIEKVAYYAIDCFQIIDGSVEKNSFQIVNLRPIPEVEDDLDFILEGCNPYLPDTEEGRAATHRSQVQLVVSKRLHSEAIKKKDESLRMRSAYWFACSKGFKELPKHIAERVKHLSKTSTLKPQALFNLQVIK